MKKTILRIKNKGYLYAGEIDFSTRILSAPIETFRKAFDYEFENWRIQMWDYLMKERGKRKKEKGAVSDFNTALNNYRVRKKYLYE